MTSDHSSSLLTNSGEGNELEVTVPTVSGIEDVEAPRDDDLLERGAKVGRYTVLERVGSGGMGVVYAAFDPELDRKIALKVMHPRGSVGINTTGGRERLMREAKSMAKLSHPNVITVHDVGTFDDKMFIAMEFIDGSTLRAWLRQAPREWSEVVDAFVKAGRGLAAAHAVGMVHRDFKPDNVLIGRDGRVLVMDFGLARQASQRSTETQPTPQAKALDMQSVVLTRTGALVGTPAYMAPEQHQGGVTNGYVDQFSFCVALYEGLYGERPFAGNSVASLAINVLEGQIRNVPKGSRVPSWLRQVVLRGLAVDPQDRFPSIDALLAELQRDPPERRSPWLTVAVTLAVSATVVGVYLATRPPDTDRCETTEHELHRQWTPARREGLRSAFSGTSLPYADTSGQTVVQGLDAWAERWSEHYASRCHALLPGPSVELPTLPGLRCLHVQEHEFLAMLERLDEVDGAAVTTAAKAVAALPDPSRCDDDDLELAISDRVMPNADDDRDRLAQFRRSIASARVLLRTGDPVRALRIAEPLIKSAGALGDPGLEAEAALAMAQALDAQHQPGQAERQLREAALKAAAGRRPGLEAEIWVELVEVAGERLGLHDEGHRLGLAAEAATIRAQEPRGLRPRLGVILGTIELDQGRYDEALNHLEGAVEQLQQLEPVPTLALAEAWQALGSALDGLGRFEEAQRAYEQAVSRREQLLGAQHPQVGAALARLGGTMLSLDQLVQANAAFSRARWILDSVHDADSSAPSALSRTEAERWRQRELAAILDRQGLLQRYQEDLGEAEALHRQALERLEAAVGPGHRDLGYPLNNLGLVLTEQDRPLDAIAQLRRGLELWQESLDPEHPDLGTIHVNLANSLWTLGEFGKAREHYAEAQTIWQATLPADHPLLAYALTGLGRCDLALKAPAAAIEALERALELRDDDNEDRLNIAETSLVLARALWVTGDDPTRALELILRARDLAGAISPTEAAGLQRVLAGAEVPGFTDHLVPAGLGTTNHNTRGR